MMEKAAKRRDRFHNRILLLLVETKNFSTSGAVVNVRIVGKYGGLTSLNATLDAGGTTSLSTWRVSTVVPAGFATIQARATAP